MPIDPSLHTTLSIEQIYALARKAGFSQAGAVKAAMVGMAESSGRTWITSANPDGGVNVGIMQLDTKGVGAGHTVAELQDPLTNLQIAQHGSNDGQDWSHWATWPSPADKFASAAQAAAGKDTGNSNWLDSIIKGLTGGLGGGLTTGPSTGGADQGLFGNLLQLPSQITDAFSGLQKIAEGLMWFLNPTNWARILSGGLGVLLLIAGLVTLGLAV